MGHVMYCYTYILDRASRSEETLSNFLLNYGSRKMGHNSVVSGHPKSIGFPRVGGLSMGPPDLGRHNLVSELRLTIT